jgi:hypothetical protein
MPASPMFMEPPRETFAKSQEFEDPMPDVLSKIMIVRIT